MSTSKRNMTEEKRQKIKDLWQTGLSASKIGSEVGLSRNSVIGAIHRMRANGVDLVKHIAKVIKPKKNETIQIIEKHYEDAKENINIIDLKYFSCRFIVSEESSKEVLYCGKRINKASYCKDHYKICYNSRQDHGKKAAI